MGITVGKPDVRTDDPAHIAGVRRGNHRGLIKRDPGRRGDRSTARRSTGINAKYRDPVMPDMPNLSPA